METPLDDDESFELCYTSPCFDSSITTINVSKSAGSVTDDYSDSLVTFDYGGDPFTVTPDVCSLSVECVSVAPFNKNLPCLELDDNKLIWQFPDSLYTDRENGIPPGTY